MESKVVSRDASIDIVKGLLIFFVVLAHFATSKTVALPIRAWGNAIYSFHMPAFIFISGYLSKRVTCQRTKEVDLLLWPFLVFQVLNLFYTKLTGFGTGSINLFQPAYLNWYILALFFWRTFLPYMDKIKPYIALSVAFVIALISGLFVDNEVLTLYRVFYFFPVFLIGYYTDDLKVTVKKLFRREYIGAICFAIGAILITIISLGSEERWSLIHNAFAPDYGHKSMALAAVAGGVFSIYNVTYAFFSTCFCLEKYIEFLESLGKNSMACYITHGFFTLTLVPLLISKCDALAGTLLSVFIAVLLCWALSRERFVSFINPLLDLKAFSKLFKFSIYRK